MLNTFITENRDELIRLCRTKIGARTAPRATEAELERGVPLFLDQLSRRLCDALQPHDVIVEAGAEHGKDLLLEGFTVAQVVRDYGGICQSITELAQRTDAVITPTEFRTLNLCLDDAIVGAVTEYTSLRAHEGTERLGRLAHELRNLLSSATLAFEVLKSGNVGVGGGTGAVLERSLRGLTHLVDRELAEARLGSELHLAESIGLREFVEDVEVSAAMEAVARGVQLSVAAVAKGIFVKGDRQILAAVVANLLQNAFKFTRAGGHVLLRAYAVETRVRIEVADECGGLPPGKAEALFRPFEQQGTDRSGLGLGLDICRRGARQNDGELHVVDIPGHGCVFTLELPREVRVS